MSDSDLLIVNDIYLDKYFYNKNRYCVLIGGRGSGKSFAAAQKILTRCMTENEYYNQKHRILVVRKTFPSLKRSCWQLCLNLLQKTPLKEGRDYILNKTDLMIQIGKNSIIFVSLDNAEKIKSIEGITSIWIEEASEITENEFITLDLCMRGHSFYYKQITLTLNPISEHLWINKRFCYDMNFETQNYLENGKENKAILKTTYKDNLYLDDKYIEVLEGLKNQNKNLYRISALGLWGGNSGLIYTSNYTIIPEKEIYYDQKIYGIDFGYNNPTAIVEVGIRDQEYYVRELLYDTGLTNTDLINKMNELQIEKGAPIYCDSAEPARIDEIKRAGFNALEADKDVNAGISYVQSKKLYIYDTSVNLIKEIKLYCWQEKQDGNYIDKPVKEWDHCTDSLRYSIYTHSKRNIPASGLIGIYNLG